MEAWRTGIIEIEVMPEYGATPLGHDAVTASKRCTCGTLVSVTGVLDRELAVMRGGGFMAYFYGQLVESLLGACADHEADAEPCAPHITEVD